MNLRKRIENLEESTGRRRVVGRWLRENEKPEVVRAMMLANGEIAEGDFIQFVRWQTREEEDDCKAHSVGESKREPLT
jgi:hypothetical protein